IFKWGGIAKSDGDRSRVWVRQRAEQKLLIAGIKSAVQALSGPDDPAALFNGTRFLMNSAMTKVYAFADQTNCLPIYDGRVGAAMAWFAVQYCIERGIAKVPAELKFAWLDGRTRRNGRNPNHGT